MKRYDEGHRGMLERVDGEWIRYADHCEAMKRIAAPSASAQQAVPVVWRQCRSCCGTGSRMAPTHDGEGAFQIACEVCRGTGKVRAAPAPSASPAALTDETQVLRDEIADLEKRLKHAWESIRATSTTWHNFFDELRKSSAANERKRKQLRRLQDAHNALLAESPAGQGEDAR